MPAEKTAPNAARRRDFWMAVFCLLIVLGALFHRSLEPDQVLFSNDGPLGPNRSQAEHLGGAFLGYWQPLNWLGINYPVLPLDVTGFLLAGLSKVLGPESGPVWFAKIYAPVGLFVLGLSVWFLCRQLRFRASVCVLAGLAASLNSYALSIACWGLPTWPLAWAMNVLAIAALVTPAIRSWVLKAVLAGFAVGLGVMEGADVGAIFSVFTAAFALLRGITAGTAAPVKIRVVKTLGVVAVMAICAGLIAAKTVTILIGTQVAGISGMAQDESTKERRWVEATQWSLPKMETLRVIIPGLFGYGMPELYGDPVASEDGSNYWGTVGQTPGVIQSRHSGAGIYAGVLVALVALWGIAQSRLKKNGAFAPDERMQIWLWGSLAAFALVLAWGKHTPVYRLVYALPYFSTIRNPIKFVFPFSLALVILFGYGLEGLARQYLDKTRVTAKGWLKQVKGWWATAPVFDKRWTLGCAIAVAASALGWLIFASSSSELVRYLQAAGFPDQAYPQLAARIVRFSLSEVGVFIGLLALSVAVMTLMAAGVFSGPRARWVWPALGLLLFIDLGRADLPWIRYWNYKDKYASNPIIDQLRPNSFEQRVTAELMPLSRAWMINNSEEGNWFARLYFEWLQHHFPYYRVQSLDINQMPRIPEFDNAYITNFAPLIKTGGETRIDPTRFFLCARLWQLTNTRYLLGMTGYLELLNKQIDPVHQRFQVRTAFNMVPKAGVTAVRTAEQLTAVPDANGQFALFEFSGALPRAKLFTRWTVNTNDETTLKQLADPTFDPAGMVLVANELPKPAAPPGTNSVAGTVQMIRYEPKRVELQTDAPAPGVLLLNDHYHPEWKVYVDGKSEPLLRCNFIMRGVYLTPGRHTVEFRFKPPTTAFYISLGTLVTGLGLCLCLLLGLFSSRVTEPAPTAPPSPRPANGNPRKSR